MLTSLVSIVIGLGLAYQASRNSSNEQEAAKERTYAAAISALIAPSMAISNYREVQTILGRLNNEFYEHAIVDSAGEIVLADFTSYALVRAAVPATPSPKCEDVPVTAEFKFTENARVVCAPLEAGGDGIRRSDANLGLLVVFRQVPKETFSLSQFFVLATATIFTVLASLFILQFLARRSLLKPLGRLVSEIEGAKSRGKLSLGELDVASLPLEFQTIILNFRELYLQFEADQQKQSEVAKSAALGKLALQVAHDIRSPLAALRVLENDLGTMAENKRIMMRRAIGRIRDIANHLLDQNRDAAVQTSEGPAAHLIGALLESVLTEKRIRYRQNIGIEIDAAVDEGCHGVFALLEPMAFQRIVSNLIDNAVEALPARGGKVFVTLTASAGKIAILIQDDGVGISQDILPRLMQRGETYGKPGGSGLGLFDAREKASSWGGEVCLSSELRKGTTVTVTLPQAAAPAWFVPEIVVPAGATVVVLDDDESIHQIWRDRFIVDRDDGCAVRLVHCSTPAEVRGYLAKQAKLREDTLFLMDHELLGETLTGLDVIESEKIAAQSFLVTSHFDEHEIRTRCKWAGVKLLPKGLAGFVPIRFISNPAATTATDAFDAVLIDDDIWVREAWEMAARPANARLLALTDEAELEQAMARISLTTPIFIDSNLAGGVRGEDVAARLHQRGYKRIFMQTGYDEAIFQDLPGLSGVLGKDPPDFSQFLQ